MYIKMRKRKVSLVLGNLFVRISSSFLSFLSTPTPYPLSPEVSVMDGMGSTSPSVLVGRLLGGTGGGGGGGACSTNDGLGQRGGEAAKPEEEPSVGSFASSIRWILQMDLVLVSPDGVVGGLDEKLLADSSTDVDMV
jgi:hypothetical protein